MSLLISRQAEFEDIDLDTIHPQLWTSYQVKEHPLRLVRSLTQFLVHARYLPSSVFVSFIQPFRLYDQPT